MAKPVLCLSGGVDSVCAYFYLKNIPGVEPNCVYFDTGVPYTKKEKAALSNLGIPYVLDSTFKFTETEIYIPYRNLYFAARARKYGNPVVLAGLADDVVGDKSENAFEVMGECLQYIGKEDIKVLSPFWNMTKEDLVHWLFENNGHAEHILKLTCSCYSDTEHACGMCPACFRKNCALFSVGIKIPFYNMELVKEYREKAISGKYYLHKRNMSILAYEEYLNGL